VGCSTVPRVEDHSAQVTYTFYVMIRHIKTDRIGTHVELRTSDILKFPWGEGHNYRLTVATLPQEHPSLYIYKPAVNGNGNLSFDIECE